VGDAVVSVLGNNHVDAPVKGDVVAVFGDVELGPHAEVGGAVVGVGGAVHKDPAAIVHGESQSILPGAAQRLQGLRPWVRHCLLLGRPLAFAPGLGWAWTLAFGFLALYVLLALLAGPAVDRCAETLKSRPGQTLLVSVLAVLLTPVLFVLLAITVIGLAVVPFLGLGLMAATLFGKAVVLAYLGRLLLRDVGRGEPWRTALAVVAGGALMLLLYCIPVVGFIVYKLLGVLGFGVVLYTLFLIHARVARGGQRHDDARAGGEHGVGSGADRRHCGGRRCLSRKRGRRAGCSCCAGRAADCRRFPAARRLMAADGGAAHRRRAGRHRQQPAASGRGRASHAACCLRGRVEAARHDDRRHRLQPAGCVSTAVRSTGPTISALGCLLSLVAAGLGFFWIAFDPEKQAWHDKIAGTVVVRAPAGRSLV
jgi:hypothetical protein